MRFVQHPTIRPQHCAVLPYMGASNSRGFIDTGSELDGFDNHVYVSVEAVEEMARMLDWVGPAVLDRAAATEAELKQRIEELEREVAELSQIADAVDLVKTRRGA